MHSLERLNDILGQLYGEIEVEMKKGTPTQTKDIHGNTIKLGDICYEPENDRLFEVVFERNAFRKKLAGWDNRNPKPILDDFFKCEIKLMEAK